MKKAKALSWARKSVRQKMPFTAVTTGSFSEVMKPQAKNRVVTIMNAAVAPPAFAPTIPLPFRLCPEGLGDMPAPRQEGRARGHKMKLQARQVEKPWGR